MPDQNGHTNDPLNKIQSSFEAAALKAEPLLDAAIEKNSFTFEELWKLKDIKTEWLIHDLLPRNVVSIIIGDDGIGKTQICTQLAIHIALKFKTFLQLDLTPIHYRVLVVATEENKEKFISAAAKQINELHPNVNPAEVGIVFMEASNLDNLEELKKEMEVQHVKHAGFDLIIMDAMTDLFGFVDGDVNSNSDANFILNALQKMAAKFQSAFLIIHHAGKGKIEELKKAGKMFLLKNSHLGAGRITSKARNVLALTHDPKSASADARYYSNYLHIVKTNYASRFYVKHAIHVPFDSATLLHNYKSLVDIQEYESADGNTDPKSAGIVKMPEAEMSYEAHVQKMVEVFGKMDVLTRKDMAKRMKTIYNVGNNAIEAGDGLINKVLMIGVIVKAQKGYILNPSLTELLEGDGSTQNDLSFTPPAAASDEEAPW